MVCPAVEGTSRFAVPSDSIGTKDDRDLLATAKAFLAADEARHGVGPDQHRSVPVFFSKDGRMVVNRLESHVSGRAGRYLATAISQIVTGDREFIVEEVVFPSVIGFSLVVETKPDDDIWYGIRPRRRGWSRFVKGREPEATQSYTVILKQRDEDLKQRVFDERHPVGYVLITGYIGKPSVPEPDDIVRLDGVSRQTPDKLIEQLATSATQKSMSFWENHAFVLHKDHNRSALVWPETLSKEYPWQGRRRYRHERARDGVVVTPFLEKTKTA
jgi:hypothetical protein